MKHVGNAILKYRWLFLAAILGLSVLFLFGSRNLEMKSDETMWFAEGDRTRQIYDEFKERFASDQLVIVAYETEDAFSEAEIAYLTALSEKLEAVPYVKEVISLTTIDDIVGTETTLEVSPLIETTLLTDAERQTLRERIDLNPFLKGNLISDDGTTFGIALEIERPKNVPNDVSSSQITAAVNQILAEEHAATDREFHFGGGPITHGETTRMIAVDTMKFLGLTIILSGVLLLFVYRSLSRMLFTLITVILALIWTLGLKGLIGSPLSPVSTTLFILITVSGIATAVHFMTHFQIEWTRLKDKKAALLATFERAGKPCLFTSLTTAIGFGSLALSNLPVIRNLGIFVAFGIASVFVLTMIIVPIGLLLVGGKETKVVEHRKVGMMLDVIGRFNLRHPGWVLVTSMVIVVGMGIGISKIQVEGSMLSYFLKSSQIRQSAEFIDGRLAGISSTELILYGDRDTFKEPEVLQAVDQLQRAAEENPLVEKTYSLVDYVKLIGRALHSDDEAYYTIPSTKREVAQLLLLYQMSGGDKVMDYVSGEYAVARVSLRTKEMSTREKEALEAQVWELAERNFPGLRAEITGWNHNTLKVSERLVFTQIQSFGLSLLVITMLMILLFGWKAGLLSIVPNVFPVAFVLGLMGYAKIPLNLATTILASMTIGIVVDDTIHYFSHFRHELGETGDQTKAMLGSLRKVGKALCFTSVILSLGFAVFLSSDLAILIQFGLLSSVAMITALLGDLFISPVLLSRLSVFRSNLRSRGSAEERRPVPEEASK